MVAIFFRKTPSSSTHESGLDTLSASLQTYALADHMGITQSRGVVPVEETTGRTGAAATR